MGILSLRKGTSEATSSTVCSLISHGTTSRSLSHLLTTITVMAMDMMLMVMELKMTPTDMVMVLLVTTKKSTERLGCLNLHIAAPLVTEII